MNWCNGKRRLGKGCKFSPHKPGLHHNPSPKGVKIKLTGWFKRRAEFKVSYACVPSCPAETCYCFRSADIKSVGTNGYNYILFYKFRSSKEKILRRIRRGDMSGQIVRHKIHFGPLLPSQKLHFPTSHFLWYDVYFLTSLSKSITKQVTCCTHH